MEKFPQLVPLITERNGAEREGERQRGTGRADKEWKSTAYGDDRTITSIHLHSKIELIKMYVKKLCMAFCLRY